MGNFIVSARKYRPQTFDTVIGQQSITNTLKNAIINDHLAQAFLMDPLNRVVAMLSLFKFPLMN